MDPTKYNAVEYGRPARRPGDRWAFWYFDPRPMPRQLTLDPATVMALSEADAAVGHLEGLGHLITEPQLLIGPYLTSEALASSRIEGTRASLAEVLAVDAHAGPTTGATPDVAEVQAYIRATYRGLDLITTLPITQRLILNVHEELMTGVRGHERTPGEFRRSPVWVGSPTDSPDTAVFVPPLPELLGDLLDDWERFVNEPVPLPTLVRAAVMHYQFETMHPFLDGNGRIGRLLIGLFLHVEGRLTTPLLYLSGYLESHRQEYYDRLQGVRERGEMQEWIQFFCTAVTHQARDGVVRAGRLVQLREKYTTQGARLRSRAAELVPLLFRNPFLTTARTEEALGVRNQGARKLLAQAEDLGWIQQAGRVGKAGRIVWVARDVLDIMEDQPVYENRHLPDRD